MNNDQRFENKENCLNELNYTQGKTSENQETNMILKNDDICKDFSASECKDMRDYNGFKHEKSLFAPKCDFIASHEDKLDAKEQETVIDFQDKPKRRRSTNERNTQTLDLHERYPKRKVSKKTYFEFDEFPPDKYIYCEICMEDYLPGCPYHKLNIVSDEKIPISENKAIKIAQSTQTLDLSHPYPKRNISKKNYYEFGEFPSDRYIYCDICMEEYLSGCPYHALTIVSDEEIPISENRAIRTAPKDWVRVLPSKIPNAGLGVWSIKFIPKGVRFGPYEGTLSRENTDSKYSWRIHNEKRVIRYVDGEDTKISNWMRYVNCARNHKEQNMLAFQYKRKIYYRSVENIPAHTELLVFYGREYAAQLNIDFESYYSQSHQPLKNRFVPKCDFKPSHENNFATKEQETVVDFEDKPQRRRSTNVRNSQTLDLRDRYPKRSVSKKNYFEFDDFPSDNYIYCDICTEEYLSGCPYHILTIVSDEKIPISQNRAMRTAPKDWVQVLPSKIPNAGLGVWSAKFIPQGVRFGPYEGTLSKEDNNSNYCWQIRDDKRVLGYLDAEDTKISNWLRYVNCARNSKEQNMLAFQYKGKIYYRTVVNIPTDTELLVFYGRQYATQLNIDLKNYYSQVDLPLQNNIFKCDSCFLVSKTPNAKNRHMNWCNFHTPMDSPSSPTPQREIDNIVKTFQ